MSSSIVKKLELKDILELTRELDGSTLESLNSSLSPYLSLNCNSSISLEGFSKLQVGGDIRSVPRSIPLYLHNNKVNISVWETIKVILAHKTIILGYVPIEFSTELRNLLVPLDFMDYKLVYNHYSSEIIKMNSLPKDKQMRTRLPNIYLVKE